MLKGLILFLGLFICESPLGSNRKRNE